MAGYRPSRGDAFDEIEAFYKRRQRAIADIARQATSAVRSKSSQVSASLNASPVAKRGAGYLAGLAGNWAGMARGALHTVEAVGQGAQFAERLINPLDVPISLLLGGPGEPAAAQLAGGVANVAARGVGYATQRAANRSLIAQDVQKLGSRINHDLNPYARAVAPTLGGEIRRQFDVGKNQGELSLDIGSQFLGGSAIKGAKFLNEVVRVAKPEEYAAKNFSRSQVRHLMRPYPRRNAGSHYFPQSSGMPRWFLDSRFNVLKPEGINRGDMYRLHGEVDTNFYGARMKRGMGAWTAKQAEVQRRSLPGRLWHGAPNELKALVAGLGGVAGMLDAASLDASDQEVRW